jgi:hypothetical protein
MMIADHNRRPAAAEDDRRQSHLRGILINYPLNEPMIAGNDNDCRRRLMRHRVMLSFHYRRSLPRWSSREAARVFT